MIIQCIHHSVAHGAREMTLNEIRQKKHVDCEF